MIVLDSSSLEPLDLYTAFANSCPEAVVARPYCDFRSLKTSSVISDTSRFSPFVISSARLEIFEKHCTTNSGNCGDVANKESAFKFARNDKSENTPEIAM